jgi:hypothetical protein
MVPCRLGTQKGGEKSFKDNLQVSSKLDVLAQRTLSV